MIDIHSHIIFGVDDGAKTKEDARMLLQIAYDQGVKTIIATSHRRKELFSATEETIANHFKQVQQIAQQLASDLVVLYGSEIYLNEYSMEQIEAHRYPTLAQTQFILVEFDQELSFKTMRRMLKKVLLTGVTPVVAHIERYEQLAQNRQAVQELIALGCYMQVNATSVLKPKLFGDRHKVYKKRAHYFLEHDLVHFVASDMHGVANRPPMMKEAYRAVSRMYGRSVASRLFLENQEKLLANEYL